MLKRYVISTFRNRSQIFGDWFRFELFVKKIVDNHHGYIKVPHPNVGTMFSIYLPRDT
jgi:hypothetical protein